LFEALLLIWFIFIVWKDLNLYCIDTLWGLAVA
jgi:hypothetical protein